MYGGYFMKPQASTFSKHVWRGLYFHAYNISQHAPHNKKELICGVTTFCLSDPAEKPASQAHAHYAITTSTPFVTGLRAS